MPEQYEIDLLRGHKERFSDTFFKWALTVGRLLVIVTETAALAVFAWRFSLDRQIVDLHDQIKQEQTIVSLLKEQEDDYRNLHERLALAKTVGSVGNDVTKRFQDILSFSTANVQVSSLITNKDEVRVDVNAYSVPALSTFVNKLKTYPGAKSVSLEKIENKTASAVIVAIIKISFSEPKAPEEGETR